MGSIATVTGTALVPGVSRNNRLYTPEAIAKAVARAQVRIAEGVEPLTTRSHHKADDNTLLVVGSLTSMWLDENGKAKYTADIADTPQARTIFGLVSGKKPHVRGVSIRGAWVGDVRRVPGPDGKPVETADDLELAGLDYTQTPGVIGAGIDSVQLIEPSAPAESADGRVLIYESAEALVTITEDSDDTEEATPAPVGPFADPGYQADKEKRYPLGTKAQAKAAWSYINQDKNAKLYSSAQLKRIKGRIMKALKAFGVQVTAERWLIDPAAEVSETISEMYGDDGAGSFCLSATNGPLSVSVSSYCIDPADLELILHAVVDGAVAALKAIDPDMDGDMDVPGADAEDDDADMGGSEESAPAAPVTETETPAAPAGDITPAPEPAADPEKEEPVVTEPITPAVATPAAPATEPSGFDALNAKFDQLTNAIGGLVQKLTPTPALAAESAPAPVAPAQETAPAAAPAAPVAETTEQMVARLVAEGVKAALPTAIQESVVRNGPPARKGLVETANTGMPVEEGIPEDWPAKPLHTYTEAERAAHFGPALLNHVVGNRAR